MTFFLERDQLPSVLEVVDGEVIPAFRDAPHFVALVILNDDRDGRQVTGLSVWDSDVPGCEEQMSEFRKRIAELTGLTPTASSFDVLRLVASRDV